jgi:hypothetical protein
VVLEDHRAIPDDELWTVTFRSGVYRIEAGSRDLYFADGEYYDEDEDEELAPSGPGPLPPADTPGVSEHEADALLRDLEPYIRAVPGTSPVPGELAERVERLARASGVDPDTVMPAHGHRNPVTGASVLSSSWPCAQCIALGRTEPLQHGRDVPDSGDSERLRSRPTGWRPT